MIDLRYYRPALVLVAAALVVAMFSLRSLPEPLRGELAPDAYDGGVAAELARELARNGVPAPGSDADAEVAATVADRFAAIGGAEVAEQQFEGRFAGEDVNLRNVIAVLPGASDRQVALIAHRDAARSSGAVTSLAATAALLEIADGFGGSTHSKTLVFVSTDGGSIGAVGARKFAEDYSERHLLDAVIVLGEPALDEPVQPFVVPWSSGPESANSQLVRTAEAAIVDETAASAASTGALSGLFRLALPAGLGEQAPLIEHGVDAVRITSAGERVPAPSDDEPGDESVETLDRFGRAALGVMLAVDAADSPPEHGPDTYVVLAGNLLPGWALSLLALALIVPPLFAAVDSLGRNARRPESALVSLGWLGTRCLPFVVTLVAAGLLSFVGLLPAPGFPFDPGRFGPGVGGSVVFLWLAAVLAALVYFVRPLRPPPARAADAAAPAVGVGASLATLAIWFANPYLALVLAPALHVWTVGVLARPAPGLAAALGIVAAGLLPLAAAAADLAARLGVGPTIVWHLLLMVTGGQVGLWIALAACVLAGSALATIELGRERRAPGPPEISIRRPATSVGEPVELGEPGPPSESDLAEQPPPGAATTWRSARRGDRAGRPLIQ